MKLQRLKILILGLSVVVFSAASAQTFDEESVPVKNEVKSEDLEALKEAKAMRSEEAIVKAAARVLGVDSQNVYALNALGVHYAEAGKLGLARIIFNRALQHHPNEPALHNNLGTVYLAEGKLRQALAEFRKSLDIKSSYRVGAMNLGSIFLEYKDFERAIAPLEAGYRATKSELKSSNTYAIEVASNYAVALSGVGKADDAEEIYEDLMSHASSYPQVLLNYAILLVEKLKKYDVATKIISKIKFGVEDTKILKRVEELEKSMRANKK